MGGFTFVTLGTFYSKRRYISRRKKHKLKKHVIIRLKQWSVSNIIWTVRYPRQLSKKFFELHHTYRNAINENNYYFF